jgi:hypothetical protein
MKYIVPVFTVLSFLFAVVGMVFFLTKGFFGPAACVAVSVFFFGVVLYNDYKRLFGKK